MAKLPTVDDFTIGLPQASRGYTAITPEAVDQSVGKALSGLGDINNSVALVHELELAQKAGVTKYTKVAIRLEPDTYCYKDGNTEQGWWDDAHWSKYGHLRPPYETFAKWCAVLKERDGVPFTYFQVGLPSDDYAQAFPGHMLFNDIARLQVKHSHHQPLVSYDYTDPDFRKHTLATWRRLKQEGMVGIKFDYRKRAGGPRVALKTDMRPRHTPIARCSDCAVKGWGRRRSSTSAIWGKAAGPCWM